MPLYTLWRTGTLEELAADALKCTAATILIATASLMASLFMTGRITRWGRALVSTLIVTCFVGVGFTIYSEWVNVYVRGTWAYSDLMPIVPVLEAGVSPLAQRVVLPSAGILLADRYSR